MTAVESPSKSCPSTSAADEDEDPSLSPKESIESDQPSALREERFLYPGEVEINSDAGRGIEQCLLYSNIIDFRSVKNREAHDRILM